MCRKSEPFRTLWNSVARFIEFDASFVTLGRLSGEGSRVMDSDSVFGLIVQLVVIALFAWVFWRIFEKAGKPGWAAIIPIYNVIVLLEIVGRPVWWVLLLFIPVVNIVIGFLLALDLSRSFGHDLAFALGLFFLGFIFYPILAFGGDTYRGPAAA